MSKLLEALRIGVRKIEAELDESKLRSHNGEIGTIREKIISKFLRPYLPDSYSLGTGQIFDRFDGMSRQIDVIIYDQLFSTVLFKGQDSLLLPYESVYGTIEVKSNLSSNELDIVLENIASVRRLKRESSDMTFILPHIRGLISNRPGNNIEFDKRKANNPLNIIFAYDGLTAETCLRKLNEKMVGLSSYEKSLMPDFIFNFKQEYMITKGEVRANAWWISLRSFRGEEGFHGYFHLNTKKDTLAMFYLTTSHFLSKIRLNALESGSYWNSVFEEYRDKE